MSLSLRGILKTVFTNRSIGGSLSDIGRLTGAKTSLNTLYIDHFFGLITFTLK
jgi:hypothetical protein